MSGDQQIQCPSCGESFAIAEIAGNRDLAPIGMQFEDVDQQYNFYYFTHACVHCGSTFVVPVQAFLPFIPEPVPEKTLTGSEECEGHCLRIDDLQACDAPCLYAPYRRHLLRMREAYKRAVKDGNVDGNGDGSGS